MLRELEYYVQGIVEGSGLVQPLKGEGFRMAFQHGSVCDPAAGGSSAKCLSTQPFTLVLQSLTKCLLSCWTPC